MALVRAAFDAWNRGDFDTWVSAWDEDAEFHPLRAQLEGRPYRGHDGLRRFIADMTQEWERIRIDIGEMHAFKEQVVGIGRVRARGRVSGVELDVPIGMVGVARGGKLVYGRFLSDPEEALRATGIREWE